MWLLIYFSLIPLYPPLHSLIPSIALPQAISTYSWDCWSLFWAENTVLHSQHFRISFLFFPRWYGSAFHSSMLCSLAFEAMEHFKAIPLRVNGWDRMGLRWFRMANPAESVISSQIHQFGVWNTAPGESDSLGDSWQEQRAWGSAHTHLGKTGISQTASKT